MTIRKGRKISAKTAKIKSFSLRSFLILASTSPRRSSLLKKFGFNFKVVKPQVKEEKENKGKPSVLVKRLALRKALSVAKKIKEGVVIGADTIVVLGGRIIGKPDSKKGAEKMLRTLSGTTHYVYTGIAGVDVKTGRKITDYEKTKVKMRKLSSRQIRLQAPKHLDKAGGYAVQAKCDPFVEKIEGDYYNVVGLPVKKLKNLLEKLNNRVGFFKK